MSIKEIWKDVIGYEEYFQISNIGNIFSKRSNRILKTTIHKNGYHVISTRIGGRNGIAITLKVHRLVAITFIPNPENKPFVNHKDGVKINNVVENLEWVTNQENVIHAYSIGLIDTRKFRGEKHVNSVLTDDLVVKILAMYVPKTFGKRKISKLLGISCHLVDDVVRKRAWKHISNEKV